MKRVLYAALPSCLDICLLSEFAFAQANTYKLNELGMSIWIPANRVVFTRDINANDPNLDVYNLTKADMHSLMLERNMYFNARNEYVSYEIIVTMTDSPFSDFNQFSNTTISTLTSVLETEYAEIGATITGLEIYQHNQAKFARFISHSLTMAK